MAEPKHEKHHFIYSTHKEKLEAPKSPIKVAELKTIIAAHVKDFNPKHTLVLEEHGERPDKELNDGEDVHIRDIPHFYSVPPANFGR